MTEITTNRPQQLPLDDHERDMIAFFFAKLRLTDPVFYKQAMPDERTEAITKRDYANKIRYLTKEQITQGFVRLRELVAQNNPDYRFLTIPKAIGVCDGSVDAAEGVQAGAHKLLPPALPEPQEYKTKRVQTGIAQCASILAMLDDSNDISAET